MKTIITQIFSILFFLNLAHAQTELQKQKRVLSKFSRGQAQTQEGIPSEEDHNTFIKNSEAAYTTLTLLDLAMDQAQVLSIGEKISHFESMAKIIVKKSADRTNEEVVRMTLNRSVDVVNSVLNIAGQNPSVIAQWTANFYLEHFKIAKMFLNNPRQLVKINSSLNSSLSPNYLSIAEYGRIYSLLLWRFSASLTSITSKAIILTKLVGFLAYDINHDRARNTDSLKEILADLTNLQSNNANFQNIISQIDNNIEPTGVTKLRSDVYYILQKLPERFVRAGIQSIGQ